MDGFRLHYSAYALDLAISPAHDFLKEYLPARQGALFALKIGPEDGLKIPGNATHVHTTAAHSIPMVRIMRWQGDWFLEISDTGIFRLQDEQITLAASAPDAVLAQAFLRLVLPFWFERRGSTVLHAATVAREGLAVGFAAASTTGKSTLICEMLQRGWRLVGDDVLVVEKTGADWLARPSHPYLRLSPARLAELQVPETALLRSLDLEIKKVVRVGAGGWGSFQSESAPLRQIYLLQRRPVGEPQAIEIRPLPAAEALFALAQKLFMLRTARAAGHEPGHLAQLSQMLEAVRVCRLIYPSNLSALPALAAAVEADLHLT